MNKIAILSAVVLLLCVDWASASVTYNDAIDDVVVPGSPFPHLDIVSVAVSHTSTDLVFTINLNGDPIATNWGKYMIGIDSTAGGDPAGNGWVRPIGMSSGMDFWLAGWVDFDSDAELRTWDGSNWFLQAASYDLITPLNHTATTTSSVTLSVPLSYLGLAIGSTILFDVYTSGGGNDDSAVDALGNPNPSIGNWNDYYNSEGSVLSYTLADVPEPGTIFVWSFLLGSVGLVAKRLRST